MGREATAGEIKKAYYAESRAFHPDGYYQEADEELKANVFKIYKRITEAYTVLRDPEKRRKYTADIDGPDRAGKLRFTEQSEAEQKKAKEEQEGKTEQGRKCYRQALLEVRQKRFETAERTLRTALMYEPDNDLFKAKLEEVQGQIKPAGGHGFEIK